MASAEPKTSPASTKLRADARRNRDRLIEVAAAAFAENGVETSLEDIARQAGVGIGTLYRHFPSREHLVEVVYRRELESLATAATELAEKHTPDVALEEWMRRFVGYIATKRGMANSLRILMTSNSSLFSEGSGLIRGALESLLKTAGDKGCIRSDIETSDLLHALSSIYSIPESPEWRERSHRLIGLLMDGLRTRR
ncbi:TetR/AcrR family transcriptional regulator [Neorhizobium galegae]|uniref:Transcriptional regulator, TetR family n=2 Tax=Neorhizobium galegae TaxID=399 RepID=A0A068STK7_NEOGA|nr:TetR/AcrR family transcriptional regulator [Neorhizobium galegae]KAB1088201.1 helix-turn-helix transcriptional regulator [Neorhizobium galegae]CDN49543.1 Transcriptional regulator, TetR family [Neorhizobium galegae bv. orientalis str. HAMBI 540]CDZ46934.1 Transcriptional regulator, TetR family [Neorhizobium galegae bv. orientalis]